eukprot:TRINITY_DN1808_c0_g1_i1.p1 TRINITY_DN1808_c0_g1~~TRINITY_DN1808_c0_g1_i1.p1  ORF type:complete len:378 (+),score=129.46 TRINITY_DN1808_c0_g1_i1:54-1136(+)
MAAPTFTQQGLYMPSVVSDIAAGADGRAWSKPNPLSHFTPDGHLSDPTQQHQHQQQLQQQQHQLHQQHQALAAANNAMQKLPTMGLQGHALLPNGNMVMSAEMDMSMAKKRIDDRLPQWGYNETKEFIGIRAELEKDFVQTKRNKTLWELISGKMKEKGFRRSADQCKCKWKNLVNRYKGKETSDPENGRQCPFFEELDALFKERAKNMDRLLLESEAGLSMKKRRRGDEDSDEEDDEEDDDDDSDELRNKRRRGDIPKKTSAAERHRASNMQEVLEDFFRQQQRLEVEWRQAMERREMERRSREQDFRDALERLEMERLTSEQLWREREEQRRLREEVRAERRDELFAVLMTRLNQTER